MSRLDSPCNQRPSSRNAPRLQRCVLPRGHAEDHQDAGGNRWPNFLRKRVGPWKGNNEQL